ncbi:uncharacterized protein G2W53_027532 [Senna tora]|uniref:Uncharacterized protein n=1 Tax=Senna tora TaxID=362788 RepID=A0A834TIW0_9FABA|nr:uncharacterized protein G2W53_027532 [Senna tora]
MGRLNPSDVDVASNPMAHGTEAGGAGNAGAGDNSMREEAGGAGNVGAGDNLMREEAGGAGNVGAGDNLMREEDIFFGTTDRADPICSRALSIEAGGAGNVGAGDNLMREGISGDDEAQHNNIVYWWDDGGNEGGGTVVNVEAITREEVPQNVEATPGNNEALRSHAATSRTHSEPLLTYARKRKGGGTVVNVEAITLEEVPQNVEATPGNNEALRSHAATSRTHSEPLLTYARKRKGGGTVVNVEAITLEEVPQNVEATPGNNEALRSHAATSRTHSEPLLTYARKRKGGEVPPNVEEVVAGNNEGGDVVQNVEATASGEVLQNVEVPPGNNEGAGGEVPPNVEEVVAGNNEGCTKSFGFRLLYPNAAMTCTQGTPVKSHSLQEQDLVDRLTSYLCGKHWTSYLAPSRSPAHTGVQNRLFLFVFSNLF